MIEPFQEKGEAVQTENEKEELIESEEVSKEIDDRKPLYDAEKIYREAQEIGVGFANTQDSSTYAADPRWNKWDERYAGKLVSASNSGIQIDIVLYRPSGNTILHSWKEGVLGFKIRMIPTIPIITRKHIVQIRILNLPVERSCVNRCQNATMNKPFN